ncbi:MAG TPA: 1-acyl-sn-glycerol-3-phosphate acyltransferase, partial [Stenomitos sp.]
HPPWTQLETLFTQIEQACGIQQPGAPAGLLSDPRADALYGRLLSLSEYLLQRLEYFYQRFSVCPCPDAIAKLQHLPRNEQLTARIQIYMESALQVAESRLGVQPQGSSVDRCRRLEQAGWERIFREDMEQLSRIDRGLADWLAEDASLALWHMRLAERLTVITGSYILQRPTVERFAEMFMLLWRITTWIEDKKIEPAPNLGPRRVCLTIGEPLSVTQRLPHYRQNRRSARDAVQTLTTDLFDALAQTMQ